MGKKFRRSLFGGFRKKDVIAYLEAAAGQRQTELRQRDLQVEDLQNKLAEITLRLEETQQAQQDSETRLHEAEVLLPQQEATLKAKEAALETAGQRLRQTQEELREQTRRTAAESDSRKRAEAAAAARVKELTALRETLEQREQSYAALTEQMHLTSCTMRQQADRCTDARKGVLEDISARLDRALGCLQQLMDQQEEMPAAESGRITESPSAPIGEWTAEPSAGQPEEKRSMNLQDILRLVRQTR